ncbi:MAG: hypothetical protein KGJ79_14285 [Alphaproteobacteria bacterium]|nr:hypothetical protein [Alphaproteobacteria bacterium]MDE2112309.1 hypothetical protein [Alphaproteobacteria bacterium]MDE2494293.1 hypothetical protein [Alphaproteobacteria bacterium]
MRISAGDFCILAGELAAEHGLLARDYAQRASASFEAEGESERARFWFTLSILLDDIAMRRLDPSREPTIH